MQSMPVEVLPVAQDDVDQALMFIAVDDPAASDRLLEDILKALDQASHFPFSGVEVTVGGRRARHYYRLHVPPYNIFYRIIKDRIVVMRVLHERMDVRRHLTITDSLTGILHGADSEEQLKKEALQRKLNNPD